MFNLTWKIYTSANFLILVATESREGIQWMYRYKSERHLSFQVLIRTLEQENWLKWTLKMVTGRWSFCL